MRRPNESDMLRWYPPLPGGPVRHDAGTLPASPRGIAVGGPSVAECDHGPCVRIGEEGDKIAMDAIDLENQIAASTTRRTIVKTGVKLAYVAPVVAVSFRVSEMRVRAQVVISDFVCPPNVICGVQQEPCGEDVDGVCSSVRSVEAQSCICGNDNCGPSCSTDDDCQSYAPGAICQAPETGCCGQVCIAPCHAFDGSSARRSPSSGSNAGE
jgi:hypothetical protein